MNRIEIPKGNGKTRVIWVPTDAEKEIATNVLWKLEDIYRPRSCVHGFTRGRSPVTNAQAHAGNWRFTLSMDISAFFDNVVVSQVPAAVEEIKRANLEHFQRVMCEPREVLKFPNGYAVQGLPCSPIIANMAMDKADERILAVRNLGRFGHNFVYTRYADDLTFSFNHPNIGKRLEAEVPQILLDYGFELNPSKTHWQESTRGRRRITGVSVGEQKIHLPRDAKRRLRAAEHQAKVGMKPNTWGRFEGNKYRQRSQLKGLLEWAKLKKPKASSQRSTQDRAPSYVSSSSTGIIGNSRAHDHFSGLQVRVITA